MANEDNDRLLGYVHSLLSSARTVGQGIEWVVGFEHELTMHLAASYSKLDGVPDDVWVRHGLVMQALARIKQSGNEEPTLEQWSDALGCVVGEFRSRPCNEYLIITPLHLAGKWIQRKRLLVVRKTRFERWSWRRVRRLSGWTQFQKDAALDLKLLMPMGTKCDIRNLVPLVARTYAHSAREAAERIDADCQLLRALINFVFLHNRWTRHFGGIPGQLVCSAVCLPAPVYGVFTASGDHEETLSRMSYPAYKDVKDLASDDGHTLLHWLHLVNKASLDMQGLLVQLLLNYGLAVDCTDWRIAFLLLWQVLEAAALQHPDDYLQANEVKRRILALRPYNVALEQMLDMLMKLRHELVHKCLLSQEGEDKLEYMRLFAEETIRVIFDLSRRLSTLSLFKEFYEQQKGHKGKLRRILLDRRKAINYLLSKPGVWGP